MKFDKKEQIIIGIILIALVVGSLNMIPGFLSMVSFGPDPADTTIVSYGTSYYLTGETVKIEYNFKNVLDEPRIYTLDFYHDFNGKLVHQVPMTTIPGKGTIKGSYSFTVNEPTTSFDAYTANVYYLNNTVDTDTLNSIYSRLVFDLGSGGWIRTNWHPSRKYIISDIEDTSKITFNFLNEDGTPYSSGVKVYIERVYYGTFTNQFIKNLPPGFYQPVICVDCGNSPTNYIVPFTVTDEDKTIDIYFKGKYPISTPADIDNGIGTMFDRVMNNISMAVIVLLLMIVGIYFALIKKD